MLNLTYHESVDSSETLGLFNDALIGKMKRGAYLINTARGKICDRDAIVRALESGHPRMLVLKGDLSATST